MMAEERLYRGSKSKVTTLYWMSKKKYCEPDKTQKTMDCSPSKSLKPPFLSLFYKCTRLSPRLPLNTVSSSNKKIRRKKRSNFGEDGDEHAKYYDGS